MFERDAIAIVEMTQYAHKLLIVNVVEPVVNPTERILESHAVVVVHDNSSS